MMLSSDKLSDLHRPILQLKLDTETSDGKIHSNLLELSVEESQRLLKSLKTAQRVRISLKFFIFVMLCSYFHRLWLENSGNITILVHNCVNK